MTNKFDPAPAAPMGAPGAEEAKLNVYNTTGTLNDKGAAAAASASPYEAQGQALDEGVVSPEMAAGILKFPFSLAAAYLGEHWEISDAEAKLMADPAARMFSGVAGRFAASNPDAFVLGMALVIVAGPRAFKTIQLIREEKSAKREAARTGAPDSREVAPEFTGNALPAEGNPYAFKMI